MRAGLVTALEQMSVYAHRPSAPHPLIYSYQNIQLTGTLYRVLTRTRDAGLDFTGRTNFIAHHLVFEVGESFENISPAEILLDWSGWRSVWDGNSRAVPDLSSSEILGGIAPLAPPCRAWREITGDSGYAASPFSHVGGCWWLHSKRTEEEVLRLMGESLRLLPDQTSESLWATTFTTYVGQILEPNLYQWKGWNQRDDPTKSGVLRGNALDIENPGSLPKGPQELEQIAREGYPKDNTNNLSTSEETRIGSRRIPGKVTASNRGMTSLPERVGGRKVGKPPNEKIRKSGQTPAGSKYALWILLPIIFVSILIAVVIWVNVDVPNTKTKKEQRLQEVAPRVASPEKTEKKKSQELPTNNPVQGPSVNQDTVPKLKIEEESKSFKENEAQLVAPAKKEPAPPAKDEKVEFTKMIWNLATGSDPIPTLGGSKIVLFDDRTSEELCLNSDVTGKARIVYKLTIPNRDTNPILSEPPSNITKWKRGDFRIVKEPQGETQWIIRISNLESDLLAIVFSNGASQTVLLRQGSTHLKIPVPADAKLEKVKENFGNFTKYITPGSTNKFALYFRDEIDISELSQLRNQNAKKIKKDLEEKKQYITDKLTNMAQDFTFEGLKNLSVKKPNATNITNFEKFATQFCTNYSKTEKTGFLTSTNLTKYTTYYDYGNEFMASNVTGTNQATYPDFLREAKNAINEVRAYYLLKKLEKDINEMTREEYNKDYAIPSPVDAWASKVEDVRSKYRDWEKLNTELLDSKDEQWLTDYVLSENPKYPLEIREGTNVIVRFALEAKDVDGGIKK
jgi:hypothetical protein